MKLFRVTYGDEIQLLANLLSAFVVTFGASFVFFAGQSWQKRTIISLCGSLIVTLLSFCLYGVLSNAVASIWLEWTISFSLALMAVFYTVFCSQKDSAKYWKGTPVIIALLVYVALLVVAVMTNWHTVNPDGVSYLSIAQYYVDGHIAEAVNAYWSPLISWLCIPLIWLGLSPLAAFRVLTIIVAVGVIVAQYWLQRTLLRDQKATPFLRVAHWAAIGVSAITLLRFIIRGLITPDLLTILAVLLFAIAFMGYVSSKKISSKQSIVLGLVIAVGFFAKAYLLPFFVVCYGGYVAVVLVRTRKWRPVLTQGVLVAVTIGVILAPWLLALHQKYDKWMLGSSNQFNMSYVGPGSDKHPVSDKVLPPVNKYATHVWEDPTNAVYTRWSPLKSPEALQYHIFTNLPKNTNDVIGAISLWSPLLIPFILSGPVLVLWSRRPAAAWRSPLLRGLVVIGVMGVIYLAGYVAVHLVGGERYLWSVLILSIIAAAMALAYFATQFKRDNQYTAIILTGVIILTSYLAISLTPKLLAYANTTRDQDLVREMSVLRKYIKPGDRLAANTVYSWNLAYLLKAKSYGATAEKGYDDPRVGPKLRKYKVQYYLCIGKDTTCGFTDDMMVEDVATKRNGVLRIYKIKE